MNPFYYIYGKGEEELDGRLLSPEDSPYFRGIHRKLVQKDFDHFVASSHGNLY